MRLRLKGINKASYKLANGERVTAYYAWRGGPRLEGKPGSPDFVASYNAAIAAKAPQKSGTLQSLINGFESSPDFTQLSDKTKKDYRHYIQLIEQRFGTFPLSAVKDRRARGVFKAWRDEIAVDAPRSADYGWTVLARLMSWGYDRGLIETNPCERGGRIHSGSRAEFVWTDDDEAKLLASAPQEIKLPFLLAIWTGQRQSDILQLPWSMYDGETIKIRQNKGGSRVPIPASPQLKAALDEAAQDKAGPIIVTNSRGRPWTSDGFRSSWSKALKKAGITGLTFHDLRGTAVTRLALAGATVPEIASVTGHSLKQAQSILDAHYLQRSPELARSAIQKLSEKRSGTDFSK